VQSARTTAVELAKVQSGIAWGTPVISIVIVVEFFTVMSMLFIVIAAPTLVWSLMFLSLILIQPDNLTSLGALVFFIFTMVELLSIYRALRMRDHYGRGV
jgi:hypothetical protein